jgi:hypothetical protein
VLSLVLVGAVQSQAPVAVVELDAKAMADKGVVLQRDGGSGKEKMVVMVGWGEIKIPLEKPVTECAIGLVRGGKELVVLAGGVRSSLDLYLVQDDGSFQRYATDGGRRLPRKFNDGAGSWPIVEGRHLLLFGYEKGAGIEFRALDFDGRVLLERRVKASVEGFSVKSDPDRGEVRVEFGSGPKPSTIRHPLAPRLELSRWGLIDFLEVEVGSSSRQFLEVSNRGKRTLRLKIELSKRGFELKGRLPEKLAPGKTHRLRIEFVPDRSGAFDVGLKFIANGVVAEHTVRLRGQGVAVKPPTRVVGKPKKPPESPLRAPVVTAAEFHPRGGGRTLVLGLIGSPPPERVVVRTSRGDERTVEVDGHGRFHASLVATAGSAIRICAVSRAGRRSTFTEFGAVPKMLTVDATSATVHCLPVETFLLTVRSKGEVLKHWRGKADAWGRRRVPLSILGKRSKGGPQLTLEVTVIDEEEARSSRRVRID